MSKWDYKLTKEEYSSDSYVYELLAKFNLYNKERNKPLKFKIVRKSKQYKNILIGIVLPIKNYIFAGTGWRRF